MDNLAKYALEGLAVAMAAKVIPNQELDLKEILMIAGVAGLTLMVLDNFSPKMAEGSRFGAGFAIGRALI